MNRICAIIVFCLAPAVPALCQSNPKDAPAPLAQYQEELKTNRASSHAHYRIGQIHMRQKNLQAAANAFREALNGDKKPAWTLAWSHILLGHIFDITGQRDRAFNEYNLAARTGDDTQGAQDEAVRCLQTACKDW